MRAVALIAAGCWALISQAMAFNIDGFYSGMTLEEVLKKLTATGIKAVPYPGTSQQLEAGPYRISFCKNDRGVAGVSKKARFAGI